MLFHRCEVQLLVFHTDLLSELGESPTLVTTPLITSHDLSDDFNMESILESSNQVVRTKKRLEKAWRDYSERCNAVPIEMVF